MPEPTPEDIVRNAQQAHSYGLDKLTQHLPGALESVLRIRAWVGRADKAGGVFTDDDGEFHRFATTPLWQGLGFTGEGDALSYEDAVRYCEVRRKDVARRLRAEMPAMPAHGEVGNGRVDNVNSTPSEGGNSATYLARRLKRDAPEIAAELADGKYRSTRQAAIAAGILSDPSPLEKAQKAFLRLEEDERRDFLAWAAVADCTG